MKNKAIIKDVFDLGYIVQLENGKQAELRSLYPVLAISNLKGEVEEYFFKNEGRKLIGKSISVNIAFELDNKIWVSQLSRKEITEQEILHKQKQKAFEKCTVGDEYKFKVSKIVEWGVICKKIECCLEAAILGENELKIGETLIGEIVKKTALGNLIIKPK